MKKRLFVTLISFVCILGLVFSQSLVGWSASVDEYIGEIPLFETISMLGDECNDADMCEAPAAVEETFEVPADQLIDEEEAPAEDLQNEVLKETEPAETEEADKVCFHDVTESVYATTCVNVRSGPGVEFEKLGMYYSGNAVKRTGIGDNGWSRIDYNGETAYMCSDYLSVAAPQAEKQQKDVKEAQQQTVSDESTWDVAFEDVSETVYATNGVNVRVGPGTGFEKLGAYSCGSAVARTGIGNNGWSRIDYNGQTAYMCSDYLSYDKVEPPKKKLGTVGRLTIPSVGIDVALNYCSSKAEYVHEQQRIVDAADSAAYLVQEHIDGVLIADHKHQGFEAMKASVPYETYAYIDYGTHTQKYVCTGIGVGKNLGNDLVDWNGVSLNYGYINGSFAMYTCNENSTNITISYWVAA